MFTTVWYPFFQSQKLGNFAKKKAIAWIMWTSGALPTGSHWIPLDPTGPGNLGPHEVSLSMYFHVLTGEGRAKGREGDLGNSWHVFWSQDTKHGEEKLPVNYCFALLIFRAEQQSDQFGISKRGRKGPFNDSVGFPLPLLTCCKHVPWSKLGHIAHIGG